MLRGSGFRALGRRVYGLTGLGFRSFRHLEESSTDATGGGRLPDAFVL